MVSLISPMVERPDTVREGRGFSIAELREAGVTPGEAKRIGLPVDARRKGSHPENVEIVKEWAANAKESNLRVPAPRMSGKGQKSRAMRGLTKSGRKLRGLVKP